MQSITQSKFWRMAGLAFTGVMVIWSASPVGLAQGGAAVASARPGPRFVEDEVLVQFHPGAIEADKAGARSVVAGARGEELTTRRMREHGKGDLEVVKLPKGMDVAKAMGRLRSSAWVRSVEPNWIYTTDAVSNDPYFTSGLLWGLSGPSTSPASPFGAQAASAWANSHTGNASVYVAVIDEGIMYNHPDLAGNVWTNPFDPVDGRDNDGNGYVDDVHGWDFEGRNNTVYDGPDDDHATHVAGTIGAVGANGKGVVGMNWAVTMISAKFLGKRGGTTANAIKAIDYITDLETRHNLNIVAINASWGGGGFSLSLLDAINRAGDAGILFVAAAGNGGADGVGDNNDAIANYPSNYQCTSNAKTYDCVVAVAAIASNGTRASFSNYGAATVDLGAPGVNIYSTLPAKGNKATYGAYSGTSMATPHVTGAAALYAASHPGATAAQIKSAILAATIPTPALAGRTATGGRLNVSGF
jgi:subtilisin family serine protease